MFPLGCAYDNSCCSQHPCSTPLDAIIFPRQTFPARLRGCPARLFPAHFHSAQSSRFPLLQRPSFGISRKIWEQVEQQPVGGIQLDAKIVNPPYLHHTTPYTCLSRSGTDFQPRHLRLIFREPPVDNYVSNSQVDASRKPMYDFQLAFSVKTVKEWLEIRQHIRHLLQLRLFLLDLRPFLQCFMLQRPEP